MLESVGAWIEEYAVSLAIFGASIVLGFVLERLVLGAVRRALDRTDLSTPQYVIGAVKNVTAEVVIAIGAYLAIRVADPPSQVYELVEHVFFVILLVVATRFVIRLGAAVLHAYMEKPEGALPGMSILLNVWRVVAVVTAVLIGLAYFGVSIAPLLAAAGIGGLALALGLQDTLSSIFAGLQILASRDVRVGDFIQLETGQEGAVIDISWRNTIIRTITNNDIIIPNSQLATKIVTNFQMPQEELSVLVPVGVSYGSDLERVEAVVKDVASGTMADVGGGVTEFEPKVRYHTFGDSSVDMNVILRAHGFTDRYELQSEFVKRLHRRFGEEGIEIPFPQRVVHTEPDEA